MRKRFLAIVSLTILILGVLCFSASCGKKDNDKGNDKKVTEEAGTVHLLNGFEKTADLYSLKPTISSTVATMTVSGDDKTYVKEGDASLKYDYEKGNLPDMLLFIDKSDCPDLDISNLNKMNVSIYNTCNYEVEAVMSMMAEGNEPLVTETFKMKAKSWNDIEFRLSALACKFNADQVVGFNLRLGVYEASTFYIDNWSVTMGAENTDEDNKYEPIIEDIMARIDALPKDISASDGEELEKIYTDYAALPELYRNIVPNYDVLAEAIKVYVDKKYAADEDALHREFLAFDKFYGIGQIANDMNGKDSIIFQKDFAYEGEEGSTMITFAGNTLECYFTYYSPLDSTRYDYVEISFYNEDAHENHRKVVYFNWNQRIVVEPNSWGTLKIPGDEFRSSGKLIIVTIDEYGNRLNSCGKMYLGAMHAYRRDLKQEMDKLPDAGSFQMRRDIKYLTLIEQTKELYDKLPASEKQGISKKKIQNLEALVAKIKGYKTVFDANTEDIQFGTPDCAPKGKATEAFDETYGYVWELKITGAATGDYAAGFQFNKDMSDSSNLFYNIYNPQSTAQTMYMYADGTWKHVGDYVLEPGWNEINIPADVKVDHFLFGLLPKGSDVVGVWKVSSLYDVSDDIVGSEQAAELTKLIQALPSAKSIKMPRDMKYVAAIDEAKNIYDELSSAARAKISAGMRKKLTDCAAAIKGYTVAINAKTDEMTVGTADCVCKGLITKVTDKAYGPVFKLNITKAAKGDYAAGFQVNKDISGSKNMFFYIYNPQNTTQIMYLYADPTWKDLGAQSLAPGWNKIELPKNAKIEQYIFGLFPKGSDVNGTWKITSVYAISDSIVAKEQAASITALIKALPAANSIVMPRDLKYAAAIDEAKTAYSALSTEGKKLITSTLKKKLTDCVEAIKGYTVVINAKTDEMTVGTADCVCAGNLVRETNGTYGPVFGLQITKAASGDYAAGFQVNKDMSGSKNIFGYIYNPQDTTQTMYLYADPTWKDLGTQTLAPGWNKIEIPNSVKVKQYIFGLFPKGSDVKGTWKISSFYGVSDSIVAKEQAAEVAELINALPTASSITMPDDIRYLAAIDEAKRAYDALSAEGKKRITSAQKKKLDACVAAVAGYEVVVNAKTDDVTVGTADCACKGTLTRVSDSTYGTVFNLNITDEATVNYSGGFQVDKDMTGSKNIFFYINNPLDHDQVMYLYADPSWKDLGAQTLRPGWNKVTIPTNIKVEKYVFGLFPLGDEITGQWKISSFYGVSDDIVAKEQAAEVTKLINALPVAESITMPDNIKYMVAIDEAKTAYDALSSLAKSKISQAQKDKLTACVAAIDGYQMAVNAKTDSMTVGTPDCICEGTLDRVNDDTYGTVFELNIINEATVNYSGGFQINESLSEYKNVFFYIYNPLDHDQVMYLYADSSWEDLGAQTLTPGWNKVELSNDKKADNYLFGLFPLGNEVSGKWKISSFYAVSDEIISQQKIEEVKYMIDVLPTVDAVTLEDSDAVNAAKAAYDALSEEQKQEVGTAYVEKLEALLSKLEELSGPATYVRFSTSGRHAFDYYNGPLNEAYADATLADIEVAGKTAKWSATVNVTAQNGGYARAYQKLELTVDKLQSYKAQGYTHLRIPYYLTVPSTSTDVAVCVHADEWEWNYKKGADAVLGEWSYFDYPIEDLLLTPGSKTVLEGINTASGAYGLININVNAVGEYKLYLGQCEMVKAGPADKVMEAIDALPAADALTLDNKDAVAAAKAAYDALSTEDKVKVTNVEKLNACVAKIEELEIEASKVYVDYSTTSAHRFDYYSNEQNAAYATATLADVEIAGKTAKWSAIVNVTQQNGGYVRAYQGLKLTLTQLQEYKNAGYTHLRIPYYLVAPAGSSNVAINVHSDRWEWNYKKGADAVLGEWSYFDYPIADLLLTPGSKTVLEGINTASGAYGLINININATGEYKLYLGRCEMIKPEAGPDVNVAYSSSGNHRFDYFSNEQNAAYAVATLADVEIAGKTAKWSAIVNVTQQNGGYARAYQSLKLTLTQLQEYKNAGYTHLRIPYYLVAPAGSSNVAINVHSDRWEWNYKKGADAVLGEWSYFDYPIADLLLTPGSKTVLEGINTASGAYGLINININATGEYKLYLGEAKLQK